MSDKPSLLALAFTLAACGSPTSADVPVTSEPTQGSATPSAVPDRFLGVWDESEAACGESSSQGRFTVSPERISWFGGTGDVTAVRGGGDRAEVEMSYVAEGSPTGAGPTTTTLALDGAGRLSLGLGGGREGLVRCSGDATPMEGSPPDADGDQTTAVRFAPGASSITLSDTLRAFALHDHLVRASEGQRLTATVEADGPGAPQLLVVREATYRGPGDFDSVPDDDGVTLTAPTWTGTLPADGVYRVRVAHSGSSAKAGTVSPYTLTLGVE